MKKQITSITSVTLNKYFETQENIEKLIKTLYELINEDKDGPLEKEIQKQIKSLSKFNKKLETRWK